MNFKEVVSQLIQLDKDLLAIAEWIEDQDLDSDDLELLDYLAGKVGQQSAHINATITFLGL